MPTAILAEASYFSHVLKILASFAQLSIFLIILKKNSFANRLAMSGLLSAVGYERFVIQILAILEDFFFKANWLAISGLR